MMPLLLPNEPHRSQTMVPANPGMTRIAMMVVVMLLRYDMTLASDAGTLVVSGGLLRGRIAAASTRELVERIAASSNAVVRWSGAPGCGAVARTFDGISPADAIGRVLDVEAQSFMLRFGRRGPTGELREVTILSPHGDESCRPSPAAPPALPSPRRSAPATSRPPSRQELLDSLHASEHAAHRVAAFDALRALDLAPDAIDRALADPSVEIRLKALRALNEYPGTVADWHGVLAELASRDADPAASTSDIDGNNGNDVTIGTAGSRSSRKYCSAPSRSWIATNPSDSHCANLDEVRPMRDRSNLLSFSSA